MFEAEGTVHETRNATDHQLLMLFAAHEKDEHVATTSPQGKKTDRTGFAIELDSFGARKYVSVDESVACTETCCRTLRNAKRT